MKFRNTVPALVVLATFGFAHSTSAFTYTPGDVLLIFNKAGANDVEFNLGSINQLLQVPSGTTVAITNWDRSLVTANYQFSDDGVGFLLAAATTVNDANRGVWLSSSDPNNSPLDRTPSQWQSLWSKASALGNKLAEYTGTNSTAQIAVSPALYPSFTYIASNGGSAPGLITKLGGTSAFSVASAVPAVVKFYEIRPSSAATKPPALLLGTFQLGTDGSLIYTAGGTPLTPPAPTQITSIVPTDLGYRIAFGTVAGTHYRLRYSTALVAGIANWNLGTASVTGTGTSVTLEDSAPDGTQRYYAVESY